MNVSNYSFDGMDDTLTFTTPEGDWHLNLSSIDKDKMHLFFEGGYSYCVHLACKLQSDDLNEMIQSELGGNQTISTATLESINTIVNKLWKKQGFKSIFG